MTAFPSHLSYARVITPATTYHAFTVQHVTHDGQSRLLLQVRGETIPLEDATITEQHGLWRAEGTNLAGDREVWTVQRLSCGCGRTVGSTRPEDIPT